MLDGFEIAVHLNRDHPGGAQHSIVLTSRDRRNRYELVYTLDTMNEGLRRFFESIQEVHNFMFKQLRERDGILRAEGDGSLRVGYRNPMNELKFINIPTVIREVDRIEMLAEENVRLSREV